MSESYHTIISQAKQLPVTTAPLSSAHKVAVVTPDGNENYVTIPTFESVLQLTPSNPLPTRANVITGSLATSGSHLYFYNGSGSTGWAQVI
jgi:hypothetical protein